jgi:hypothetical protein
MLDTPLEIGIVGATLIILALIALRMARSGGKTKARLGPKGLELESAGADPAATLGCPPGGCIDHYAEHAPLLEQLVAAVAQLTKAVEIIVTEGRGTREVLAAQSQGLDVLLGLAEGEEVNGQVKAARSALTRAEGYKEATEAVAGGKG